MLSIFLIFFLFLEIIPLLKAIVLYGTWILFSVLNDSSFGGYVLKTARSLSKVMNISSKWLIQLRNKKFIGVDREKGDGCQGPS